MWQYGGHVSLKIDSFKGTTGEFHGDTCHHSQGDMWQWWHHPPQIGDWRSHKLNCSYTKVSLACDCDCNMWGFLPRCNISCVPPYKDFTSGQVNPRYEKKWKGLPLPCCDCDIFGGLDLDNWQLPCQGVAPKLKCIKCQDVVFEVTKEKAP